MPVAILVMEEIVHHLGPLSVLKYLPYQAAQDFFRQQYDIKQECYPNNRTRTRTRTVLIY